MKHVTFLTALCIAPYAIHSMDKPEYVTPHAMIVHAKAVQTLCLSTQFFLADFDPNKKGSQTELVDIIERMNNLKLAQPPIQEKEIGFYCYKEKENISAADCCYSKIFGSLPMPVAKSIFFARLAQYNDDLKKNCLTSPNNQEVKNYFKNLKRENLITKNAQHNIIIPQQTINAITIPTPDSVGAKEFATLLTNIKGLLQHYSLEEMHETAEMIYHDYLTGKPKQP
jgi:hypothetical protein